MKGIIMSIKLPNINFGYACISALIKNCSTAKTVPLKSFRKIEDEEARKWRLERVARENLDNTIRLLWHNISEGFKLYRFSSQLIPLGNHPEAQMWDFTDVLYDELKKIGKIVRDNKLWVSTHPGQYTVINTNKKNVFENAVLDLVYHDRVLSAMGLDENAVMVVHVGGVYGDKEASMERFIKNFRSLPESVKNRIVIENDDTSYSIKDVLYLCDILKRPMVLDVHHHNCYNQGEVLEEYLTEIFATWKGLDRPSKVHFSSPRTRNNPLKHADYINYNDFLAFIEIARDYTFDVMIEAKKKDAAILRLWEDIDLER
jgi:UV DNA damage endonuclease